MLNYFAVKAEEVELNTVVSGLRRQVIVLIEDGK